ncbi:MAG TPA: glycosyltransferase family 39 protein [Candidatus Cryosericum sp.]|nr:glycosyltransferase family 39 protein [Candidatus Cryosericum sp.]
MLKDRWLAAILVLGASVRLFGLGDRSLSYDECQQFWASQGNVLVANRDITLDPPGFALLLDLHATASRSETWLRLLPCLFGVLGIAAVYRLARAGTGDPWTARAAAFFMALAPYPIRYSQSLRVYSQAMLFAAILTAAYLEATEERETRGWKDAVVLGLAAFCALLSVYGSLWLVLMIAALLARRSLRRDERARRATIGLLAGVVAAAPFYLASIPVQMSQGTPASFYDDKFMPLSPLPAARFLLQGTWDLASFFGFIHPTTGLLFGSLAILGMAALRKLRPGADLLVLFLGSLAAAAAASAFRLYPFGGTRQMLFAAPLFYVFGAAGIAALRPRLGGLPAIAGLVAIACGSAIFLYRYHTEPGGQEMRPVLRSLEDAARPDDRILVNKDASPQFRFYFHGDTGRVVAGQVTVIGDYLSEVNRVMATGLQSRWWLVFSHGWSAERRQELDAVDPRFVPKERFEAHRAGAYLFVPRDAAPAGAGTPP